MKTNIKICIIILAISFLFSACNKQEDTSWIDIRDRGYMIVGILEDNPPLCYKDENDSIVGFEVDTMQKIAYGMGIDVVFKPIKYENIINELTNGTIDVIGMGFSTINKKSIIKYSDMNIMSRNIIIVLSSSDIKIKTQISQRNIGVIKNSKSHLSFLTDKEYNNINDALEFKSLALAFDDLYNKNIDALITDEISSYYYIKNFPDIYTVLDDIISEETIKIGTRKEDIYFNNLIQETIDLIVSENIEQEISEKWFEKNLIIK